MTLHAFWRAFMLVALGIFLRSIGRDSRGSRSKTR